MSEHHVISGHHRGDTHGGAEIGPHLLASPYHQGEDADAMAYIVNDPNMIHMTTDDPSFLSMNDKTKLLFGNLAEPTRTQSQEKAMMDAENISPSATVSEKATFFAVQQKKVNATPSKVHATKSSRRTPASARRGSSGGSINTPGGGSVSRGGSNRQHLRPSPLKRNNSLTNITNGGGNRGTKGAANKSGKAGRGGGKNVLFVSPPSDASLRSLQSHGKENPAGGGGRGHTAESPATRKGQHRRSSSSPSPMSGGGGAGGNKLLPPMSRSGSKSNLATIPVPGHHRSKSSEYCRFDYQSISPSSAQKIIMDNPAMRSTYIARQGGDSRKNTKRYGTPQLAGRLCVDRFPDAPQHFIRSWAGGAEYYSPKSVFKPGKNGKWRRTDERHFSDATELEEVTDDPKLVEEVDLDEINEFIDAMGKEQEYMEQLERQETTDDFDRALHGAGQSFDFERGTIGSEDDSESVQEAEDELEQQNEEEDWDAEEGAEKESVNAGDESIPGTPTSSTACLSFDEDDGANTELANPEGMDQLADVMEGPTEVTSPSVIPSSKSDLHSECPRMNYPQQPPVNSEKKVESSCQCVIM